METMEQTSTDKRIDDLRADMGHRFEGVGHRFEDLKAEMDHRFGEVDRRLDNFKADVDRRFIEVNGRVGRVELQVAELRAETNAGFAQLNARFDGLYKIMLGGGAAIFVAVLGILARLL